MVLCLTCLIPENELWQEAFRYTKQGHDFGLQAPLMALVLKGPQVFGLFCFILAPLPRIRKIQG